MVRSNTLKIIAWSVLIAFSANICVYADPGFAWRVRVKSEYGRIKERAITWDRDTPTIVILEDAHTSVDAQKNIAALLDDLSLQISNPEQALSETPSQKNPSEDSVATGSKAQPATSVLLGIEGAAGALDQAAIASFPVRETKEKVLADFMAAGKISGAEYHAFTTAAPLQLFGLEDRDSYLRNHALFTETLTRREALRQWIEATRRVLSDFVGEKGSPSFKETFEVIDAFRQNRRSFDEHLGFLTQRVDSTGLELSDMPSFQAWSEIRQIESAIDPEKLHHQIEMLSEAVTAQDPDPIIAEARAEKNYQAISYLVRYAREHAVPKKDYAFIEMKMRSSFLLQTLDFSALLRECESIATRLLLLAAASVSEKELVGLEEALRLLATLVSLEAQPHQVRYFRPHTDRLSDLLERAETLLPQATRLAMSGDAARELLAEINAFYTLAEERNEIFIDRTIESLKRHHTNEAVIISGGYHTPGLSDLLRARGLSYVVITPHVSAEAGFLNYKDLMLSTREAYTEFIRPSFNTLQTIRSCWPLYEDLKRASEDGRAFQQVIGAELFVEEATRRVLEKGSIRLSNIQYKESLYQAGWPMADLYDLRAIYEIGEELGLVEVRVNSSGTIYKSFRPAASERVELLSEHKKSLLAKVSEYLDLHLGRETFTSSQKRSLYEQLHLLRTELARIETDDDASSRDIFIRALLERLPNMPALEIALDLDEKEKTALMQELFPRFDGRLEEVRALLETFKRDNPSSFDLERSDEGSLRNDLHGFIESHLLYWIARQLFRDYAFIDGQIISHQEIERVTRPVVNALLAFLSDTYDPVEYEEKFLFLVSELGPSAEKRGYLGQYEISFRARDDKTNTPECFQCVPLGRHFSESQKLFLVFPQQQDILENYGITHPVDVRSTELLPPTRIRRWSDILRSGNEGQVYRFARGLRRGGFGAMGLRDKDGRILIDERLRDTTDDSGRELLRQVLLHEIRGHFVIGHLRKYDPLLFNRLVDVLLDQTDKARYDALLSAFIQLAGIAGANALDGQSPETVLARSPLFGARNMSGAVIGIDRARLAEEILAYWQQIRHARRAFIHPRALFEETAAHADYEAAARELAQTVDAIFDEYRHVSGEDIIKKAGFDMSWAEIFTLDPTGLEPMPICWARDLESSLEKNGRQYVNELWLRSPLSSGRSATKVVPGDSPVPIEVIDAFLASLGNGLVFMNMRPVDPEKEKMIYRGARGQDTKSAWDNKQSDVPKRTKPTYEKIIIVKEPQEIPFSVQYTLPDARRVSIPYVARLNPRNPFIVFEGTDSSHTVWSFHDRAGNMYMSEHAYRLMSGAAESAASGERRSDGATTMSRVVADQTRLHELSELFCYDWQHRGPDKYIKRGYVQALHESALREVYEMFQKDLLTREKVLEYIRHKQKERVHHLDHYYSQLYELVDTFFRALAEGSDRLAQYGITRSIESFLAAQGVADMSELSLMDIERIVERSFLDEFLVSLKEPTEKYLLVNGAVFLSDINYRQGKVYAKDGLGREQTAVNMWLKEQIARHKENQLMSDERLAVKVAVFLEGDSNDMDLLRAYLQDARAEIDTWVIFEDVGEAEKTAVDLARYGITPDKIIGVINENRSGTFTPRDPVYGFFVGENIITHDAYKELDPNRMPFEIIETDGTYARVAPSFFQAAEAICDPTLLSPGESPLIASRIQFVSPAILESMKTLIKEVALHNQAVRTAA
jgi:hypothetical protein